MKYFTLLRDGVEGRSFVATLLTCLLILTISVPIGVILHYSIGEPLATIALATVVTLTAFGARAAVFLKFRKPAQALRRPSLTAPAINVETREDD